MKVKPVSPTLEKWHGFPSNSKRNSFWGSKHLEQKKNLGSWQSMAVIIGMRFAIFRLLAVAQALWMGPDQPLTRIVQRALDCYATAN